MCIIQLKRLYLILFHSWAFGILLWEIFTLGKFIEPAAYNIQTLPELPSMPTKKWFPYEVGNEIVMKFLLSFISSLDFKPFVPIEANSRSVY